MFSSLYFYLIISAIENNCADDIASYCKLCICKKLRGHIALGLSFCQTFSVHRLGRMDIYRFGVVRASFHPQP